MSRKGNMVKLSKIKAGGFVATVAKVLVVLVKSGVCLERLYIENKGSLRVLVV